MIRVRSFRPNWYCLWKSLHVDHNLISCLHSIMNNEGHVLRTTNTCWLPWFLLNVKSILLTIRCYDIYNIPSTLIERFPNMAWYHLYHKKATKIGRLIKTYKTQSKRSKQRKRSNKKEQGMNKKKWIFHVSCWWTKTWQKKIQTYRKLVKIPRKEHIECTPYVETHVTPALRWSTPTTRHLHIGIRENQKLRLKKLVHSIRHYASNPSQTLQT